MTTTPSIANRRLYFKQSTSWKSLFSFSSRRNLNNSNISTLNLTTTLPAKSILKIATQEESERIIYGLKGTPLFDSIRSSIGGSSKSLRSLTDVSSFKRNNNKAGDAAVVYFNNIEVREYATIVGDNPHCSSGVALSLDWNYTDATLVSVDEYENLRRPRKKFKEMKLSDEEREDILLSQGVTHEEIGEAFELQHNARERRLHVLQVSNRSNKKTLWFCPFKFGLLSRSVSTADQ